MSMCIQNIRFLCSLLVFIFCSTEKLNLSWVIFMQPQRGHGKHLLLRELVTFDWKQHADPWRQNASDPSHRDAACRSYLPSRSADLSRYLKAILLG